MSTLPGAGCESDQRATPPFSGVVGGECPLDVPFSEAEAVLLGGRGAADRTATGFLTTLISGASSSEESVGSRLESRGDVARDVALLPR